MIRAGLTIAVALLGFFLGVFVCFPCTPILRFRPSAGPAR